MQLPNDIGTNILILLIGTPILGILLLLSGVLMNYMGRQGPHNNRKRLISRLMILFGLVVIATSFLFYG